jgi:hypothetical protein
VTSLRPASSLLSYLPYLVVIAALIVLFVQLQHRQRDLSYEEGRAYERGKAYADDRWNLEPADVMRFCTEHAGSVVLTTDYPQPEAFRDGCSAALNSRLGVSEDR